jgi:hypothetical protein
MPMRTFPKAAAVLVYPVILCLVLACEHERERTPTASPPANVPRADLVGQTTDWVARALLLANSVVPDPTTALVQPEDPIDDPITVVPFEFDPFHTSLVRAFWMRGIGCPTGATTSDGTTSTPFSDPACITGDPKDGKNKGLLLVKTGPTSNFAAAGAVLNGVKGISFTAPGSELGYDIRKPTTAIGDANDPRGSHCGAGAPRFNVVTSDGIFFVGCNSPPATTMMGGPFGGWLRLRWGLPAPVGCVPGFLNGAVLECITGTVQSITIIFDEGQDASAGPDMFGLAVLDNIDINGTIVGRGPGN